MIYSFQVQLICRWWQPGGHSAHPLDQSTVMKSTPPPTETRRSPRIASPAASVKAKATPPHSPKVTNPPRRKSPLANKANLKNPAANISGRRRSNSLPTKSAEKQATVSPVGPSTLQPPSSLILKISPSHIIDPVGLKDSPQSPMSPIYKPFPPFHAEEEEKDQPSPKQRAIKGNCPCRASSEGKEWLLKCCRCSQHWHASCSNLKGANQIGQIDLDAILQHWECPWCFTSIHPKPNSSTASKMDEALQSSVDYSKNIQAVSDAISSAVSNSMPTIEISSLEARLLQLSEEIHSFQKSRSPQMGPPMSYAAAADQEKRPTVALPKCVMPPIKDYQVDILDKDLLNEVTSFLTKCKEDGKFSQMNGRSVLKYGESYTYSGDSNAPSSSAIPPPLAAAIDRVTSQCILRHKPNSVLINYFPPSTGAEESMLPFHSDDEPEILADSEIATISIGEVRIISFAPVHEGHSPTKMTEISLESNSAYIMTRSSQAWFKHGIRATQKTQDNPEPAINGRFSITLRTISNKFKRSTIILGDSNTKTIKFGCGAGTMGQSFPGERVKAGRVGLIDPCRCIGYSNVVIVCGTNDLRVDNLRGENEIHQLVDILNLKIQQIRKLCPSTKIFVAAVLPSRLPQMNKNIMTFNRLVEEMLSANFNQSVWHLGVGHFLDSRGLLATNLTRVGDDIHLGVYGIAKFVRCVKHWVYVRERQERTRRGKHNQSVGSNNPT